MKHSAKIIFAGIGITAVLAVSLIAPLAAWAQSATTPAPLPTYTQVVIPGEPVVTTVEGFVRGKVTDLAQYIGFIYNFLIGIIGLVAGVSIMIGGFTYLTAGGDKSKVEDGKKRIYNALAGMVIAFTAYLLLNTINPNLVNLKVPTVATIVAQKVPFGGYQPIVWPEHLCSQDSDCTSLGKGYKCAHNLPSGPGKQDGQCALEQSNAPSNVSCTADSQCAKNQCLKSSASSDSGWCSTGSEGDICYSDNNCVPPRKCIDPGGKFSYCSQGLKGSFCSSTSDCLTSDLVCKVVGSQGRCTSKAGAGEGEACAQDTDCANSNLTSGSESVDQPALRCLKPPGGVNSTCKTGGDYAENGQLCFCHAYAPQAAMKAGTGCYNNGNCDNTASPALQCKKQSVNGVSTDVISGVCG